jgi:hypothetical protein
LTVADTNNPASVVLAAGMATGMGHPLSTNPPTGQAAGSMFTLYTKEFLEAAFGLLFHLRPGDWIFSTSQASTGIAAFDQYEHLRQLTEILRQNPSVRTALGGGYYITPDIVVAREPVSDHRINEHVKVVQTGEPIADQTPLRAANTRSNRPSRILHASISCKWSIRSDRVQNTRTEALNLMRNRKGHTPHIVAVTSEPLPSRLASIALGTGDIDCVYHAALYELQASVAATTYADAAELLNDMIIGRRLRDISDLPFDLAV